jgi:hypothetical protein
MKRVSLFLLVATAVFVSLSLISQTPVAQSLWPWMIGLAGPIIRIGQLVFHKASTGRTDRLSAGGK